MPKIVSSAALGFLSQQTGTEPVIVIGIAWSLGVTWYSSREAAGYNANIVSMGSVRSQRRGDAMCNTSSVNVTFSDTDGIMSGIMDGRNIEKAKAVVFLGFAGGTTNDFVELIRGITIGPATWNEGERTFSFDIESIVQSNELGFAPTANDFDDLAESAVGVPWPMMFGTCAHVPAVQVREHTVGHLKFPIKLYKAPSYRIIDDGKDFRLNSNPDVYCYVTEPPVKGKFWVEGGSKFDQSTTITVSISDVIFKGKFSGDEFTVEESNAPRFAGLEFGARSGEDAQNPRVAWLAENGTSIVNHHIYLQVAEGHEWYNYVVKQIDNKVWFRYPVVSPITQRLTLLTGTHKIQAAYTCSINGMIPDIAGIIIKEKEKLGFRRNVSDKDKFGRLKATIEMKEKSSSAWWQVPSDEEVRLWDQEDPDIYIASLIPLTEIKAVFGRRRIKMPDGKTKEVFEQIPESYYQKQLEANYAVNGVKPSGLLFFKSLHDYAGQDWTGEVHVTGTSTVGPNSARIIKWILENYTELNADGSFGVVEDKVQDQEAHFALFDKRDALKVAQEIAFQSRCGLILDSERVGIRFLAEEPLSGMILSEENTEFNSMVRSSTGTNDIVTKLIAPWTDEYLEHQRLTTIYQRKVSATERAIASLIPSNRRRRSATKYGIYTENVEQFGLRAREESCYIYCEQANVQLFLNFWGHRFANSWQLLRVKVPLEGVIMQVFDGCVLSYLDMGLLKTTLLKVQIEEVEVNPSDWSVVLGIWLPRKSGSVFQDSEAWPV